MLFYIELHIFWYLLLSDKSLYLPILLFSDTLGTHTSTDSRTAIPTLPTTIPRNRTVTRTTLQVAAHPDPVTRRTARATTQKQVAPPLVLARRNRKRARTTNNSRNNSSNRNRNRHSLSSRSSPRTDAQGKRSWSTYISVLFFCGNWYSSSFFGWGGAFNRPQGKVMFSDVTSWWLLLEIECAMLLILNGRKDQKKVRFRTL